MARKRRVDLGKCKRQLNHVMHSLERAIETADSRGYTGMVNSRGGYPDDPRVKSLTRKYDRLLDRCRIGR